MKPLIRFLRALHARDLPPPALASAGSSGYDLRAAMGEELILAPGARALVPTGLFLEIPVGWEAQVRPRSGLALRHGVGILNSPGTIDSDYRGEVGVILINWGAEPFAIRRGDRIAQLVFARVEAVEWQEVERLVDSDRGAGGFGSTGS
ncbi:MAG TPA: dUTP diphosphatase [Thermoanaerobaculia bacterium]|jgi:dUTP pyrophosphatase|nr:dUTP diphosphatase [Thermoanaerobaculia bacterium]